MGKNFKSSRLALIERDTADSNLAQEKAQKYSVGEKVTVYYDPRKPEFAVLAVGDPTKGILPIGMAIIGIAMAIVGVVWFVKTSK